jgi:hypothetical protein
VELPAGSPCVGVLALVICAGSALAAATAATAAAPGVLADHSLAVAMRQRSVHYELHTSPGTGSRTTMVCDIGQSDGVQRIAYTQGGRTGNVVIRVVGRTAYVRGDAFALHGYMGFREEASRRYAPNWIKVPSTDRAYASIADAATLRSEIDLIRFVAVDPPVLTGRISGQQVLVVRGTRTAGQPDAALLYIRKKGVPLPVAARLTGFSGAIYTTLFSNWNESIQVTAPSHSLPISSTDLR